jgi:hypothetical protein
MLLAEHLHVPQLPEVEVPLLLQPLHRQFHLHHLQHTNQPIRGRVSGSATNERTGPQMNPKLRRQTLSFISITCSANQPIRSRVSGCATNERTGPQMNPLLRQQTLSFILISCSTPINQSGAASQAARPMREPARK